MKVLFSIIFVVLLCTGVGLYFWYRLIFTGKAQLTIGNKVAYNIEIRDEPIGMARGLSERVSLGSNEGMLFVYSSPRKTSFWMKDMNFSLDFVWIRDFKVVQVDENIPHPDANNGEVYRLVPSEPVDMVLEVNSGEVLKQSIQVGDDIDVDGN